MSRGSFVDQPPDIPDNLNVNSKILLVYEEYSEMMGAQSLLLKGGFDVLAISTEYTLSENVLSFNPDIVVASGRAGKVTTLGVGRRLREMTRWQGKVILVLPSGYKPNPQDFAKVRADMLLEAPVAPLRLMQIIAKMLGIDEQQLQERLGKHVADLVKDSDEVSLMGGTLGHEDAQFLTGGGADTTDLHEVRGSPDEDDGESFIKAKAKFNLDLSGEENTPAKAPKDDTDLESLWKELATHSELSITPEDEVAAKAAQKRTQFDLAERQQPFTEEELLLLHKDLENVRKTDAARVSKYEKYTAQIKDFDPRQSLNKMASRRVQQDLAKSWNHKGIEDQDELRRTFTKALFRKK